MAGLCGICLFQWHREARLRGTTREIAARLQAEILARHEAEARVTTLEAEVNRISGIRDDLETRYQQALGELRAVADDSVSRGQTILALADLAASGGPEAVQAQNEAIQTTNERIRQLVAERDDAIRKLNARTREYNELVRRVNAERRRD